MQGNEELLAWLLVLMDATRDNWWMSRSRSISSNSVTSSGDEDSWRWQVPYEGKLRISMLGRINDASSDLLFLLASTRPSKPAPPEKLKKQLKPMNYFMIEQLYISFYHSSSYTNSLGKGICIFIRTCRHRSKSRLKSGIPRRKRAQLYHPHQLTVVISI